MSGPPKISLSLGIKKPTLPLKKGAPGPAIGKRSRSAFLDDGPEDDGSKAVELTGFDKAAGGAIQVDDASKTGNLLVIHVPSNRKKQKSIIPDGRHQNGQNGDRMHEIQAKAAATQERIFGLNVPQARVEEPEASTSEAATTDPVKPQTEDEIAMDALINGRGQDSSHVIQAVDEDTAFGRDYDNAPDVPTEADYAAVPIEQFGAALLRGMGWKDGQGIGKGASKPAPKAKAPERRPAMLGVGAKPAEALGIEIGAWGNAKKGEREKAYNPVVLKNKVTGEVLTEAELKDKLARQAQQDFAFERNGKGKDSQDERAHDDDDRKEKRRDRNRDDDDRDRRRRRERSDSRDKRRRDRSSDRYKDDQRDRQRDRSRDRRREKESRSDRDRDRDYKSRSSRYDDDKSRDSVRDREREKDRDRRRRDDDRQYEKKDSRRDRRERSYSR